jgi:hypothetical protein
MAGPNVKTKAKYLHVARMWIHYCLTVVGMFYDRWSYAALDSIACSRVAVHMHNYSECVKGLSNTSLESYMHAQGHDINNRPSVAPNISK